MALTQLGAQCGGLRIALAQLGGPVDGSGKQANGREYVARWPRPHRHAGGQLHRGLMVIADMVIIILGSTSM